MFCVDEEDEADDDEDEMPHLIQSFVESNEEMSDGNVNEVEEAGKCIYTVLSLYIQFLLTSNDFGNFRR